jgi:hypothetical protein
VSTGKSNPRRKKYLFFVLPVKESFACWQPFQLDFGAGARIAVQQTAQRAAPPLTLAQNL